jgi:hypothetical protein
MSDYDELEAAAQAARYLVSTAACIRGLIADGESEKIITELKRELNQKLTEASKAIRNVEMELRRTRTNAFRIGDISAPTAHEAAIKIVHGMNREWFGSGLEIVGDRKRIVTLPELDEVRAEITLEHVRAKDSREREKEDGPLFKNRVMKVLTRQQQCIMEHLWIPGTASFDTLQTVPGAFRDDIVAD